MYYAPSYSVFPKETITIKYQHLCDPTDPDENTIEIFVTLKSLKVFLRLPKWLYDSLLGCYIVIGATNLIQRKST